MALKAPMLLLLLLGSWRSWSLEYPLAVGTQVLLDATTTAVGGFPMLSRFELWVLDERKEGVFDSVWATYAAAGQPGESLAGAIPVSLKKDGGKEFPMEREATYKLQEQVESFVPTLPPRFDRVWRGPASVTGWYSSYQPIEVLPDRIRCSFTQYGLDKMDQVYGTETLGEIFFNSRYNWVTEMRFSTKQPSPQGPVVVAQAQVKLRQVLPRDQKWVTERKGEAKEFFNAVRAHDDGLLKANDNLEAATMDLKPVLEVWDRFLAKNPTSRFTKLGQTQFRVLQAQVPALQQLWLTRKRTIGSPAPPWTLSDTQGGTYTSQSFDSPVLLLFWSRANWWSLMALRDAQQIQQAYQSKGLLVLPVNVDATDQEAVQTLSILGIGLTTLRNYPPSLPTACGIPPGYYPSTVLIDRNKRIADVRYGWGEQVAAELKKRIEKAL